MDRAVETSIGGDLSLTSDISRSLIIGMVPFSRLLDFLLECSGVGDVVRGISLEMEFTSDRDDGLSFAGGAGAWFCVWIVRLGRGRRLARGSWLSFPCEVLCFCWRYLDVGICDDVCVCDVAGSGLMAGRGLSSLRVYVFDDRGVLERPEKVLEKMGDSKVEVLVLSWKRRESMDVEWCSEGSVLDRNRGLGP